jgi:hypothetical protein
MLDALFAKASTPVFRVIALIVTLAMGYILSVQGAQLQNQHAPRGVVSLEFAATGQNAREIVDSWKSPRLKRAAYRQVALDFIFIPAYVALLIAIALSAKRAANAASLTSLAWAAGLAACGALAAGVFDCLENIGLLAMIAGCISTPVAFLTALFATAKFAFAITVMATALLTFIVA